MGLGFLALAWNALGEGEHAVWYERRLQSAATPSGELPESWCHDPGHEEYYNSPLCWSHALHVIVSAELGQRKSVPAPAAGGEPAGRAEARGA